MSRIPTPAEAEAWTVLRTEVGSRVLGVSVEGTDDRDLLAIAVEPPEWIVGLAGGLEQPRAWQYRTKADGSEQPDGARSGPGDTDLTVHPLRKWMRLALGGNPTVLMSLFAPPEAVEVQRPLGRLLRANGHRFVSERAREAFGGYLEQQRRGLTGEAKTKTNRPELVERYGYDTKYAYHAVRLGLQGVEFLNTGRIELPMRLHDRQYLLAVRAGEVSRDAVLARIADLSADLGSVERTGGRLVPSEPDTGWADRVLVKTYFEGWLS